MLLRFPSLLLFVWLWAWVTAAGAFSAEDLLPPDEAFPLRVEAAPGGAVAKFDTPKGYYLYKTKISVASQTPGVKVALGDFPPAVVHEDPNFGRQEVYYGAWNLPLQVQGAAENQSVAVQITTQGCADAGVCYPPMKRDFAWITLANAAGATSLGESLGLAEDDEEPDLLDAEDAFAATLSRNASGYLLLDVKIAAGYSLYQHQFKLTDAQGKEYPVMAWPKAKEKDDPTFGQVKVYAKGVQLVYGPLSEGEYQMRWQGCADAGVCYVPMKQKFTLSSLPLSSFALPAKAENAGSSVAPAPENLAPEAPVSETDAIAGLLANQSAFWVIMTFFGLGLLLSLTPCVFPMIPILSSIIVGQGSGLSTRKAFILSLVYVLAMALTYTLAGVLAGLFGANLQASMQNPWVLSLFSLIFVALAFSMFGFYEIGLPSSFQSKINELSNKQQGGSLIGVAIMGFLSALIVGPCMAPPLAGALLYIGQTGDALLGGASLFALSMGMGVPLILVGTAAGKFMPRAGGWMITVTRVFGVLLLAVALWMMERVWPEWFGMLAWAMLMMMSAVYMGALSEPQSPWQKLWKGLGLVLFAWGLMILIGLAAGSKDMLQPLKVFQGQPGLVTQGQQAQHLAFETVTTSAEFDRLLAQAKSQNQGVMVDFYADWCVSCKEMEKFTFSDGQIITALAGVKLIQVDVTDNTDDHAGIMKRFNLVGPPAILFMKADGSEVRQARVIGYQPPETFLKSVKFAFPG